MKKQKDTKKSYLPKKTRRSRKKYPALKKNMNLKLRYDYIEPDYADGVYDKNGNELIRPLNKDEKKFLNQYYEEVINTNFYHDDDLKILLNKKKAIINGGNVKKVKKKIAELKEDGAPKEEIQKQKEILRLTKKQNKDKNEEAIREIEDEIREVSEEKLLYPEKEDHKKFYDSNNARNRCLYNRMTSAHKMDFYDTDEFNRLYLEGYNKSEDDIINDLEREMWEEQEQQLFEMFQEEKRTNMMADVRRKLKESKNAKGSD